MLSILRVPGSLLLAAGLILSGGTAHGEQLLRWNFKPGESLKVDVLEKLEIETTVANKTTKMNVEMFMGLDWEVEAVDEQGTAQLAQSFTRLRLKMDVPRQDSIEFDSAAQARPTGPAKDVADAVGPLIGAKFFLSMNARGEIVDVKLSEEAAKLLESPAAARWKETFSKEGLTDLLRQSAAVLPEKEVEAGSSWTVPATAKSPLGPIGLTHKYTYVGREEHGSRQVEKITVETTLALKDAKGKPQIKDQKQSGVLWFDGQAGRFVETQLDQQLVTEKPYRDTLVRTKATSSLQMKITSP